MLPEKNNYQLWKLNFKNYNIIIGGGKKLEKACQKDYQ